MTLSEEVILSPDRIESTAFTVDLATFACVWNAMPSSIPQVTCGQS